MRYGIVLGFVAAGVWATAAFAQDCCAGSKRGERIRYNEESGSSLEAKAWTRVSAPPPFVASSDAPAPAPADTKRR